MDSLGFDAAFWQNGPSPGQIHNFPGKSQAYSSPAQHSAYPITTGTSVLGVKFNGGVMIAADKLGSYGSLQRFKDFSRVLKVNDCTIIGAGGDLADYQYLKSTIEQRVIDEECLNDGFSYTPKSLFSWLTRTMYYRRCKFDPLWNSIVVGGLQDGEPYLGYVNLIGTAFESNTIASGLGAYMAQPMLRDAYEKNNNMTEKEARDLLERCLRVLFYRDCATINKYEIAVVTKEGSRIDGPLSASTNWETTSFVKGYE